MGVKNYFSYIENMWHLGIIMMPCCLLMLNILCDFLKKDNCSFKFNNLTVKSTIDQIFNAYCIDTSEIKVKYMYLVINKTTMSVF